MLYVLNEDVPAFMDNTAIEAYPDTGANGGTADDGVQDPVPGDTNACAYLADVGDGDAGLDPTGPRTRNDDTRDAQGNALPLINLDDVKPGDFGEVTFSFHLCDNPGYVWLNAANVSADENGLTEPEAEDPDEGEGVELLDEIQTAWWYDQNCDNLTQPGDGGGGGSKADIVFVIDSSGSMSDDRNSLEQGINSAAQDLANQGLDVTFSVVDYHQGAGVGIQPTTDVSALESDLNDGPDSEASGSDSGTGGESLSNAILFASQNINFRSNAKRIYVGFTDEPDQSTPQEKSDAVTELNDTNSAFLGVTTQQSQASELLTNANQSQWVDLDSPQFTTVLEQLVGFVGGVTGGEQVFFQGDLRTALGALTSGNGIPLDGDASQNTAFDELKDPDDDPNRECFPGLSTHCIGFAWWLPVDHANEIQSDSVAFDLGFYAEQCRHNTGAGMPPETTTSTPTSTSTSTTTNTTSGS
ncbi:MAG: vWA domain-containing protein [Haloplanus sp.]